MKRRTRKDKGRKRGRYRRRKNSRNLALGAGLVLGTTATGYALYKSNKGGKKQVSKQRASTPSKVYKKDPTKVVSETSKIRSSGGALALYNKKSPTSRKELRYLPSKKTVTPVKLKRKPNGRFMKKKDSFDSLAITRRLKFKLTDRGISQARKEAKVARQRRIRNRV